MHKTIEMQDINHFDIIFEKLEEAKKEQKLEVYLDFNEVSETTKTVSLFQEFQESNMQPSYAFFTRS